MTKFATLNIENGRAVETNVMEININAAPSSDPLAFSYGFFRGRSGVGRALSFEQIHGAKYSELAQEYLRGFLFGYTGILVAEGTRIRKGQERNFALQAMMINKEPYSLELI